MKVVECFEACLDFQAGNPDYASLKKDHWMLDIHALASRLVAARLAMKVDRLCVSSSANVWWTASFCKGTILYRIHMQQTGARALHKVPSLWLRGQNLLLYISHGNTWYITIQYITIHHNTSQYITIHHNTSQLAKRARTDAEFPELWSGDSSGNKIGIIWNPFPCWTSLEEDCEEGPAQSPEASPGISRAEQVQFACLDTCKTS